MTALLARSEYPDEFRTTVFGPFDVGDFPAVGTFESLPPSSSSSSVNIFTNLLMPFFPDKNVWIDAAWVRMNTQPSTAALFRLIFVNDGQDIARAVILDQALTVALDLEPGALTEDTRHNLVIATSSAPGSPPVNKVEAGGLIVADFDVSPTALDDLFIGIRWRDREP